MEAMVDLKRAGQTNREEGGHLFHLYEFPTQIHGSGLLATP